MDKNSLADVLARNTKEAELYKTLPDGRIQCFACGHRCPIPEGHAGVCRVRFNEGGKLFAPSGYVGALQDDPIEKKPFFHAMPGARALSFGMLGCDLHCSYCLPADTRIATSEGLLRIEEIVQEKKTVKVITPRGVTRPISEYFSRPYFGKLIKIKAAFLPEIKTTPEHPFLARLRPDRFPSSIPSYIEAGQLTRNHCLSIPKHYAFSERIIIDVKALLEPSVKTLRIYRRRGSERVVRILRLSSERKSSSYIGKILGMSSSHVRHLRSKVSRGYWDADNLNSRKAFVLEKKGRVRFSKEHDPGIPSRIVLDERFAELLGYYCAEGCVSESQDRVHSATLNFAFSKKEEDKALRVCELLSQVFGIKAYLVHRATTLAVASGKSSLAHLFKALCGGRGVSKKVPVQMFEANRNVAQSFLNAYVAGDGYRTPDDHIRISTISQELAWGVAWLVQKLGYLPQFYVYPATIERKLLGRTIKQKPWTYMVRWYEKSKKQRHVWEDEDFRYVLIKDLRIEDFAGQVYNLEVETENAYLANFAAVHNCQNWITSQALRDPEAVAPAHRISAKELVKLALQRKCQVVASTYNEPLITSEWAVEIFKEAKKAGLVTAFISNGNATPEALDYIQPWVDLYKVDLKTFDERRYRELGGTLENVCETIKSIYARGIWLETLTLLIPGFNDSENEIKRLTEFIASVSPDIPWHVTAFHQDYKMNDHANTRAVDLIKAAEIGKRAGLRYIYTGNLPGMTGDWENTYCPDCRELLIRRTGFRVIEDKISCGSGKCPKCSAAIPGFWRFPPAGGNSNAGPKRPV